jgi:hypothetical protein
MAWIDQGLEVPYGTSSVFGAPAIGAAMIAEWELNQ